LTFLEEKREELGANLVIQIRWTKRDNLWLSPFRIDGEYFMEACVVTATMGSVSLLQLSLLTRITDPSLKTEPYSVAIAMLMKGFEIDTYFRGSEAIFLHHGGRPHYGKLHFLTHTELSQIYGDKFQRFLQLRQLVDPSNMFMNRYLQELLLPKRTA